MARVRKTMDLINKSSRIINEKYDICTNNISDIRDSSADSYDFICNGFRFGYMQGLKAAREEMKKGGVLNG